MNHFTGVITGLVRKVIAARVPWYMLLGKSGSIQAQRTAHGPGPPAFPNQGMAHIWNVRIAEQEWAPRKGHLLPMTWRLIEEELPPFDHPVLVVWLGRTTIAILTTSVEPPNWQEYPDGDFDCGGEVTKWQPLPEP